MLEQPPYMGSHTGQHRSTSVTDVWERPDVGIDARQRQYTSLTDVEAIIKGRGETLLANWLPRCLDGSQTAGAWLAG